MRNFWHLYLKDLRFLMWPAVTLFMVLWLDGKLFHGLIPNNSNPYFYAILFLYTRITGQKSGAMVQLNSLPVRRSTHLAATYAATVTWGIIPIPFSIALWILRDTVQSILFEGVLPSIQFGDPRIIATEISIDIISTVFICALAAFAYTVAVSIRKWPILTGVAAFSAGYILVERILWKAQDYWSLPYSFYSASPPYTITEISIRILEAALPDGIFAVTFFMIAAFIYERFCEA